MKVYDHILISVIIGSLKIPTFNRNAIGNINLYVFEILRVIPFSYNKNVTKAVKMYYFLTF